MWVFKAIGATTTMAVRTATVTATTAPMVVMAVMAVATGAAATKPWNQRRTMRGPFKVRTSLDRRSRQTAPPGERNN